MDGDFVVMQPFLILRQSSRDRFLGESIRTKVAQKERRADLVHKLNSSNNLITHVGYFGFPDFSTLWINQDQTAA